MLFVSLCEGCKIRLTLCSINEEEISEKVILNTEEEMNWKRVQLPFRNISKNVNELFINVYTEFKGKSTVINKFWKIYDEIKIYDHGLNLINLL